MSGIIEKTIFISGASSGLGRALALQLAENNRILINARRESLLEKLSCEIEENGGEAHTFPCDLQDSNALLEMTESINQRFQLDGLIHSAGLGIFAGIEKSSLKSWNLQFDVNIRAAYLLSRAFLVGLRKKKGQIVFINSVAGRQAFSHSSAYVASKWALRGFADALREELRPNVKVCSVYPGAFDSGFWDTVNADFPRDEMMTAEDIAEQIVHAIKSPNNLVAEELVLRRPGGDF